ncbi:MAG TPA: phosphatase domain-containing protein [Candidatus Nanopelagicales bacterium]
MGLPKPPGWSSLVRRVEGVDVVRAVHTVDQAVNAGRIEIKRRRESLRPTVIVTYRGWYGQGVAHLVARAIEKPVFTAGEATVGTGEVLKANLRRFLVLTIEGVTIRASMAGTEGQFTSDSEGYLHIDLPVGELSPGWHVLDIDPVEGSSVEHTTGRIFVPDPAGGLAVVSDIDDTILKTGLTQRWTVPLVRTTLRDVADRKPVPGMAELYAALARGISTGGGARRAVPFYYVSTGSWNYYDYLVAFLNLHRFPRGPLFLTDWGPRADRLMRDGREHKRATIRALLRDNPTYEFVLIGDVGQGDPETYEVMAREFPDQVRAIVLLYVGSHLAERTAEVSARAARLREDEGVPMYFVQDAAEAATAAWQLGLVEDTAIAQVVAAIQRR